MNRRDSIKTAAAGLLAGLDQVFGVKAADPDMLTMADLERVHEKALDVSYRIPDGVHIHEGEGYIYYEISSGWDLPTADIEAIIKGIQTESRP